MIRLLLQLFREPAERRRLALFGLSAVLALATGFILISPAQAEKFIGAGGYYYMLGLVALFAVYASRVCAARRPVWREWLRRPSWPGLAIAVGALFVVWSDPFKHKILFDEYVLQGTAFHMHATKEIGTTIRAYDIQGTWLPIDTFLDKRPYFFTFLVSLVHDFTGYRLLNAFLLNVALAPVFLGFVYWLGRALAGRGPALLAVGLLATMPLLGQQASGAGMELHNLTMLAGVMVLGVLYLRVPDGNRLSLLVLGAVLLSQSRYESVIFVLPTAIVILAGWLRAGRAFLTWPAVFAPLLLVPYAWHNRVLSATPLLWQLQEGQTSRFSATYLVGNLEGAWAFFFNFGPNIANSGYLSVLGLLGVVWALACAWRWARTPARAPVLPETVAVIAFGGGIGANLTMIMFYYWSHLDDVIASRFALPMCLLLALLAAILVQGLSRHWAPAPRFAALGLAIWVAGWCVPAIARHTYTSQNLVMQEVEWEYAELRRQPGPLLFISNKSTIPFVLWHVPTVINGVARQRTAHIQYHLKEGTFREVIVAQALRPTSPNGDMGVDPDDLLPDLRLEPIAQKRFGARWARLSRVISIEPAPWPKQSGPPVDSAPSGNSPKITAVLSP